MNMNDYRNVTDRIRPDDRCREEVLSMRTEETKRKSIKHRPAGRVIAAAVAAAVMACGGTAAAAKLGAFDKLINKKDRTLTYESGYTGPIDKFDRNEYEKIAPHAVSFEEVSHAENEFFSVDLDSAYFDGTELILGFTGSMKNGNPEGFSTVNGWGTLEINGQSVRPDRMDGQVIPGWGCSFVIDEGTTNNFTGSMTCILPYAARFDGSAELTVNICGLFTNERITSDENRSYSYEIMPERQENRLSMSQTVTADTSLVRQVNRTAEQDGFSLTVYSITPAMMICKSSYPESYDIAMNEEIINGTSDGHVHSPHPMCIVFDDKGNFIEPLSMDPIKMGDNEWAAASVSTDSSYLTIKWCDKNCESNENGSVEYDDQYGHHSFGYLAEMTLDLT